MSDLASGAAPGAILRDVSYRYPHADRAAIDGISLRLEAGQVVGVAGRNGSGKTTLVKLVAGLLRPQSGAIEVDGLDTARHDLRVLAAHAAFAFQNPGHQLFAPTVAEELAFGPRNLGVSGADLEARVAATADSLGLQEDLTRHPYRLGLSRRKLVAVASVLTMEAPVLVLDEPATGQDHRTVRILAGLVRARRAAGTTVIIVAHDTAFLAEVADRLVVLDEGRVVGDGSPRSVFGDADLVARARIVPPQVTRLALRLRAGGGVGGPLPLSVAELAGALGAKPAAGTSDP